jgi:anti-sigma factor RsiW
MVRGRKTNDSEIRSGRDLSGHLDDWTELAVDYVDGSLDAPTAAAIQAHLQGCPDCARRLAAQHSALALFTHTPLVAAPADLQTQVLTKILEAREATPAARRLARKEARRKRALLNPAGPWLPAMAAGAAVLALALALTVSRHPAGLGETMTTMAAALSAEASSAQTLASGGASTTSPVPLATSNTVAISPGSVTGVSAADSSRSAALQPAGPYLKDRYDMVTGLSQANAPAYFFFDTQTGGLVTAVQADAIAARLTSATGLELIDQDLSSGVKAFAAFVPREDSAALVDLLRSISDSLRLSVCLSLQPGVEVTSWATKMLQDKYSLAELSASPSGPPPGMGWLYTTSTAPPTTGSSAKAPKVTLLDEAGTHVLVVIFMAVQE